ncbi:MAG: hypothetical protein ACXWUX_04460 [Allosphingosinicella sp.]
MGKISLTIAKQGWPLPQRHNNFGAKARLNAAIFSVALMMLATPAASQTQSLGIFGMWGAFRGDGRCYAISQPLQGRDGAAWQPFVSVGHWPVRRISGQLHVRLSQEKRPGSAVLLRIDGRSFQLRGGGRDAWAPDARADNEIMSAMRTGIEMTVETRSTRGLAVRDRYRLRGAATAIDAAALACAG